MHSPEVRITHLSCIYSQPNYWSDQSNQSFAINWAKYQNSTACVMQPTVDGNRDERMTAGVILGIFCQQRRDGLSAWAHDKTQNVRRQII